MFNSILVYLMLDVGRLEYRISGMFYVWVWIGYWNVQILNAQIMD